jgi:hypothetical protein
MAASIHVKGTMNSHTQSTRLENLQNYKHPTKIREKTSQLCPIRKTKNIRLTQHNTAERPYQQILGTIAQFMQYKLLAIMAEYPEYGTVMRIDDSTQRLLASTSHELILDTESLHVRQYCRTMTLAQGRILYQLVDGYEPWQPRHCGFMVPTYILAEARKISCRDRAEDWKGLHPLKVRQYEDAWSAVFKAWPGIPVFGARKVVERMVSLRLGCGKYAVDEAVVRYATRNWTSYWVRLEASGVSRRDTGAYLKATTEVEEQVAGRLKEVLERWTTPDVALPLDFFRHHGLEQATMQSSVQCRSFI